MGNYSLALAVEWLFIPLPRKEWLNLRMDMNNFEKNIQDYSQNIKKYVAEVLSILLPNFDNPGSTMGGGLMPLRSLN